jgi:pilus assembly protein CpaE
MHALIVSDHDSSAQRIRDLMLRAGVDCPAGCIVPIDAACDRLTPRAADLIVLTLAPDPERALGCLAALRRATANPVLVIGSSADPRWVLRTMRAGANDYLDESEAAAELPAALERIRKATAGAVELARTIVVLAPSGGSGSSTVAANIATVLASKHKSALLVDLKLHAGDLAALLDVKPTHTLADLCQNAARLDRVMFERSLTHHKSGVRLLSPALSIADVDYITPEGVSQVLNLGRHAFPYVVVDLDHSFGPEQVQALRQASVVLLVVRLDFTCLRNAQRTLDHLERLGIRRDRICVVVNRYGQAKEVPAGKAEAALGVKIGHYIPEDPKTVNRANNSGIPVVLEAPAAKVARSLTQLAFSVNGQAGR